jgi:hypothetical protein
MSKKVILLFTFLTLAACLLSYKFGSTPVALAKGQAIQPETAASTPPLPAPPAEWSLFNVQHSSTTEAIVIKPGVSGVQHVADCIVVTATTTPGTSPNGPMEVALIDGTTTLMFWYLPEPPYSTGQGQVTLCGLNLQGTAGNSMTLASSGFQAADPWITVNLVGHDAT